MTSLNSLTRGSGLCSQVTKSPSGSRPAKTHVFAVFLTSPVCLRTSVVFQKWLSIAHQCTWCTCMYMCTITSVLQMPSLWLCAYDTTLASSKTKTMNLQWQFTIETQEYKCISTGLVPKATPSFLSLAVHTAHNVKLAGGLVMYHHSSCALTQHTDYAMSNCQPCKLGDRKATDHHCPPWQPSTDSRHNPH